MLRRGERMGLLLMAGRAHLRSDEVGGWLVLVSVLGAVRGKKGAGASSGYDQAEKHASHGFLPGAER